jgi:hypothetical protein
MVLPWCWKPLTTNRCPYHWRLTSWATARRQRFWHDGDGPNNFLAGFRFQTERLRRASITSPAPRGVGRMTEPAIRDPNQIRQDCVCKLRQFEVSPLFQAILGCLLGEDWTTPRLVEMHITADGHILGRCDNQVGFSTFRGASEDLIRNIHGVAPVAELDGDELGYLLGKVAEIK